MTSVVACSMWPASVLVLAMVRCSTPSIQASIRPHKEKFLWPALGASSSDKWQEVGWHNICFTNCRQVFGRASHMLTMSNGDWMRLASELPCNVFLSAARAETKSSSSRNPRFVHLTARCLASRSKQFSCREEDAVAFLARRLLRHFQ